MPIPSLDQGKCIQCLTCVNVCPVKVYTFDSKKNKVIIKYPKKCIGCKLCENQCPTKAIKIKD